MDISTPFLSLSEKVATRTATVGICGLGYVGLPLAMAVLGGKFSVVGFDVDPDKTDQINAGRSYLRSIPSEQIQKFVDQGKLRATTDFAQFVHCDVIIICVPTPLTRHREPDLSFVSGTVETIAKYLRPGQIVVLESTTYPGTTREVVKPLLEAGGLRSGVDFFVAYSPEREDPGSDDFKTAVIPKVVSGDGTEATDIVAAFYSAVVKKVVPVSTPDVAEATKITENVFRAVNIALVNELKIVYERMGIDVWEVIEACKTKPFGFMPFYPGPGLGGHCIPIDPFYLTWKSHEYEVPTRFIELAGEINISMPRHVVGKLDEALGDRMSRSLDGSRILVVGLAYKKNVADIRESPSLKVIELLERRGVHVEYHDPFLLTLPNMRDYPSLCGMQSVNLDAANLSRYDAAIIITDHDAIDYRLLCESTRLVVDTRNAVARAGLKYDNVVKA
jgi:UDP-N-acetyl-D-glucosamine dehydrogenase